MTLQKQCKQTNKFQWFDMSQCTTIAKVRESFRYTFIDGTACTFFRELFSNRARGETEPNQRGTTIRQTFGTEWACTLYIIWAVFRISGAFCCVFYKRKQCLCSSSFTGDDSLRSKARAQEERKPKLQSLRSREAYFRALYFHNIFKFQCFVSTSQKNLNP